MSQLINFIKPCRVVDELYSLSGELVSINFHRQVETSVVLDLNILNMMKDVVAGDYTLSSCGLDQLVEFFNAHHVFITPGFAFGEADKNHVENLYKDYQCFMSNYCPSYIDAKNCLKGIPPKKESREFQMLGVADYNSSSGIDG